MLSLHFQFSLNAHKHFVVGSREIENGFYNNIIRRQTKQEKVLWKPLKENIFISVSEIKSLFPMLV